MSSIALAEDGNIEAIRSWLVSGADINVRNKSRKTPLMYACQYLEEECVTELLKLGANVNITDKNGETALHYVVRNFDFDLKTTTERISKALIKAGCDLTKRNKHNETFAEKLQSRDYDLATKLEKWMKKLKK